jgi:hypothetical protein
MAGHSRSNNGVASLAYARPPTVFIVSKQDVDARNKSGHDVAAAWPAARNYRRPKNCCPNIDVYVGFFDPAKTDLTLSNNSTFTPLRRMM